MHRLAMNPEVGERLLRHVGDSIRFTLRSVDGAPPPGWKAFLRTNLGRAEMVRAEIIQAHTAQLPVAGASWRDIPLHRVRAGEWQIEFPLHEVGFFKAKAYAVDPTGRQHWPEGSDVGVSIHPNAYRTANIVYCAFTRLYGPSRVKARARDEQAEAQCKLFDQQGYTVIPPSGKLRDLAGEVPHIMETLGCRILHLLPINPTPTTYARMGRYGSPYAALDFTEIDPALVAFDQRTTAVDQFGELADAVHLRDGRLFLDLAINHTGWGSTFINHHPEWFLRREDGSFASPGAWGTTWEDLVELSHRTPDLWDTLAEAFLTWCHRGVDGFRCDAGYKVPLPAWQYIIARVRREFPDTIFLLEGLGGAWEATESLLCDGGMQWAYSELFQNYSGKDVAWYLDYFLRHSRRMGLWVHYSETHDNLRLAATGRDWSLLRNRLCALTSASGAFGFTGGVEWLATEKINVHQCAGLNWGAPTNLVQELAQLSRLLAGHPCFYDGAQLSRLSPPDAPVYLLRRDSQEGADRLLVLVNTDVRTSNIATLSAAVFQELGEPRMDLLTGRETTLARLAGGQVEFHLAPGECRCLSVHPEPKGLCGEAYRLARAQAAWAVEALTAVLPAERIGVFSWRELASELAQAGPAKFLSALPRLNPQKTKKTIVEMLREALRSPVFPRVVEWSPPDRRRITPVPPDHWLLVEDAAPFRASLEIEGESPVCQVESVSVNQRHFAAFKPRRQGGDAMLALQRCANHEKHVQARVRYLDERPAMPEVGQPIQLRNQAITCRTNPPAHTPAWDLHGLALFTNGLGGMARMRVDLGGIKSKYDCLLGANLHPEFPVDRHVFAKRARVWVIADGFLSPLDGQNLEDFCPGPPGTWRFLANAGDGRCVDLRLQADMLPERNVTVLRFHRPAEPPSHGSELPADCDVRLTVRIDVEDRNFHGETHRNPAADHHFGAHTYALEDRPGFRFCPAPERALEVYSTSGTYNPQPEWCENIAHPVEQSRGQTGAGDAYSPGWFDLPLTRGQEVFVVVSADVARPLDTEIKHFASLRALIDRRVERAELPPGDAFGHQLALSVQAYLVKRNSGKTVIAGYPWFLDWGRDSLICARGLLAAGWHQDVRELLQVFGRFAENGTLPNSLHGDNASDRDTTDAPLWFCLVCEEAAGVLGEELYRMVVGPGGRTLAAVIRELAAGYLTGTPNGIRVDAASWLVWSPAHFTWMDTNYPAGTPREGYPVEIQALWIRVLRLVTRLHEQDICEPPPPALAGRKLKWRDLAEHALTSFNRWFWLEDRGYLADVLLAKPGIPAESATPDNALRGNQLIAISLDVVQGERARQCVQAALRHLVVPGALRSLAPLPVTPPLPIYSGSQQLLNNPAEPYWGHYEGDEDTRRKPAYHNGTAWTWTYPIFCEALAKAWEFAPAAVAAARAYLGGMNRLLMEGCAGHPPEIVDGDAPHAQRGCDAQAWGATEALRVWKKLSAFGS